MKLLIIGHSVEDHIHTGEENILQPGGIYYTAAALNSIKNDDDIYLCTSIEKNNYSLFSEEYIKMNLDYLQVVDEIPKVHLIINPGEERKECYQSISGNLDIDFRDINSFDGIIINMVTGFDVSLEQLKMLRSRYKGVVYLDVHTLARGLDDNMERNFRKIPRFDEWAEMLDIIQVNQSEVKTISRHDTEKDAVFEILTRDGQILIVTKDEKGAVLYQRSEGNINWLSIDAINIDVKNKIGCGDVFGAIFFYNYIKSKDVQLALIAANTAAGLAASYEKPSDIGKLKDDILSRNS